MAVVSPSPQAWYHLLNRERLTHSIMGGLVLYPLLNVDVYLSKCLTNIDLRVIQNIIEDPSIILA